MLVPGTNLPSPRLGHPWSPQTPEFAGLPFRLGRFVTGLQRVVPLGPVRAEGTGIPAGRQRDMGSSEGNLGYS